MGAKERSEDLVIGNPILPRAHHEASFRTLPGHGHVSSLPSTCDCVAPSSSSVVLPSFYPPLSSRASIFLGVVHGIFLPTFS